MKIEQKYSHKFTMLNKNNTNHFKQMISISIPQQKKKKWNKFTIFVLFGDCRIKGNSKYCKSLIIKH